MKGPNVEHQNPDVTNNIKFNIAPNTLSTNLLKILDDKCY